MKLKTVTHFSQGGLYPERKANQLTQLIEDSGSDGIRDGISWKRIEEKKGNIDFTGFRNSYPDFMAELGIDVTMSVTPGGNPLYDKGKVVTSAKAVAAFADFIVAIAQEFPEIGTIVIGNEFNGLNADFVNGRAATRDIDKRVAIYTKIVAEVSKRLDDAGLDVKLGGGALHSVATGYVQAMQKAGTFAYLDTLDFHPYGISPVEVANSLERMNAILDTLPPGQRPALIATEFGQSQDPDTPLSNANYLAKMVAVLADAGVETAAWYALMDDDRGASKDMGLYHNRSTANAMLDGFRHVSDLLDQGAAPRHVPAAPGIELYDFGTGTWLVWGSVQQVVFAGQDLVFRNVSGEVIDRPDMLTETAVYVTGQGLSVTPASGSGEVLADSFYDFALSPDPDGAWSYHALKIQKGKETLLELSLMDGQTRMGESWNPYLGHDFSRPLRLSADVMLPVGFGKSDANDRALVERYTAEQAGTVDILGTWGVTAASDDGVIVEIELNGTPLTQQTVTGQQAIVLRGLTLKAGDQLDFILHDGANSSGDYTTRHIRVLGAQEDQTTQSLLDLHVSHDILDGSPDQRVVELDFRDGPLPEPTPVFDRVTKGTEAADKIDDRSASFSDAIYGLGGDDTIRGRKGDDLLDGGEGQDFLRGDTGEDTLKGGAGNDRLFGNKDDDDLDGGHGDDVLKGGNGDDRLLGGAGADTLSGNGGGDIFVFDQWGDADVVTDFDRLSGDVLDLSMLGVTASDLTFAQSGAHAVVTLSSAASQSATILLRKTDAQDIEDNLDSAFLF